MSAHRSARPRVRLNRGHLSCAAQWMLEGSRLRGVMPKNHSRLWLRRCHCRQLPHTGVSARLAPLAFPYQHEPPPKNLAQSPTSPTHQHRHRRPPSAFDPTTAQPSRRESLFMPHSCHCALAAPVPQCGMWQCEPDPEQKPHCTSRPTDARLNWPVVRTFRLATDRLQTPYGLC